MDNEISHIDSRSSNFERQELATVSSRELSTHVRVADSNDLIDSGRIIRVLLRYRNLLVFCTLLFSIIGYFYSLSLRPQYTATATIRYNPTTTIANVGASDMSTVTMGGGNRRNAQETSLKLLASRPVGQHVVQTLNLLDDDEFAGRISRGRVSLNPLHLVRALLPGRDMRHDDQQNANRTDEQSTVVATSVYLQNIRVAKVLRTDLIQIYYTSFSPLNASRIANQVVHSFNALEAEQQQSQAAETLTILNTELAGIQDKLLFSEKKMTQFARRTGLVDLEENDNLINVQKSNIQKKYVQVQSERQELENKILAIKNASNRSSVESLLGDADIFEMRKELSTLRAEQRQLSRVFQPEYPKLKSVNQQIAYLKTEINRKFDVVVSNMVAEYEGLFNLENKLETQMQENNEVMLDIKDQTVAFNILKREYESNKKLYEGMLEKVKRAGLAANLERSRLSMSEQALVPTSKSAPDTKKNVFIGSALGAMCGLALAFIFALRDRQFRSVKELEDHAQIPVLAVVPLLHEDGKYAKKNESRKEICYITYEDPSSQIGEVFRSLRTSLIYSLPGREVNKVMITSSNSGEGKTTSIINLATTFARNGNRTVIIDFDLRKPSLHNVFALKRAPGVTDGLVSGKVRANPTPIQNLFIVSAGSESPNPTEMIESQRCKELVNHLHDKFDIVLFDSPPVMGLADALVLSQYANLVVMAVDFDKTNKDMLRTTLDRLRRVNSPLVGVVVTRHDKAASDAYSYEDYAYYDYNYKYSESDNNNVTSISASERWKKGNKFERMFDRNMKKR